MEEVAKQGRKGKKGRAHPRHPPLSKPSLGSPTAVSRGKGGPVDRALLPVERVQPPCTITDAHPALGSGQHEPAGAPHSLERRWRHTEAAVAAAATAAPSYHALAAPAHHSPGGGCPSGDPAGDNALWRWLCDGGPLRIRALTQRRAGRDDPSPLPSRRHGPQPADKRVTDSPARAEKRVGAVVGGGGGRAGGRGAATALLPVEGRPGAGGRPRQRALTPGNVGRREAEDRGMIRG